MFRFHALIEDRSVNSALDGLAPERMRAFRDAVDFVLEPFENAAAAAAAANPPSGHLFAHLYNQALVALLSAVNSSLPTRTLVETVRRTARALVGALQRLGRQRREEVTAVVRRELMRPYVAAAQALVWGGAADAVQQAFL